MSKNIQLSLLLVALLSSANASQTITLQPLSVTSTAIETNELQATDAIEVYTQKDIEEAHVQNVYEFLNKSTSVFTTSAYGNPFMQKIDMRGFGVGDGYQNIVVTINGRKMNNVDMVSQLLSSISPSSIEKIEIIKSSGIIIGGDGANAGAINIITKQSNDKEISFYMGTYGLVDGSFFIGHQNDRLSINLSGEAQKNDGIRHIDNNTNKDENKFSTFTLQTAYQATNALELRLNASTTHTDIKYMSPMLLDEYKQDPTQTGTAASSFGNFPGYFTHQKYKSNVLEFGTLYDLTEKLSLNVDFSKEIKKSEYVTYSSFTDYDYNTINTYLNYQDESFSFKVGFDGFDNTLETTNSAVSKLKLSKKNKAIYAISEMTQDKLTLKAGYRYEKSKFENTNGLSKNYNLHGIELGANYLLNPIESFFINYTRSYHTAELDRLFSYFTGSFTGYVEPSKAHSYTIGYNNITGMNKLKISAFYIDMKNEIYYSPSNFSNKNLDESHKYGFDIYDKYLFNPTFNIALNYNYVKAIIDKEADGISNYNKKELPGVSNHNLKATLNYLANKNTTLSLTQVYRSETYAAEDFNNNFFQKQKAYNATDITLTYTQKNYEFFAKINNIFNQKNGIWIKDDAIYPVNFTTTALAGFKYKY